VIAAPARPIYGGQEQGMGDLLRNPYVLAAGAVIGAIILAVVFVFFFGGAPTGAGFGSNGASGADSQTPRAGRGVAARSLASTSVRDGPGLAYGEIGVLRANQDIEVAGRNSDGSWLQIYYPRNTQLRGWVPASALSISEASVADLQVAAATPISRPTMAIPTQPPLRATSTVAPLLATPIPTQAPVFGPDLAVSTNGCQAGAPLVLSVSNSAGSAVSRSVGVTVTSSGVVLGASTSTLELPAGGFASISTGVAVQAPITLATVDLLGTPADPNPGNNTVQCSVQAVAPATSTPALAPTETPIPPTPIPPTAVPPTSTPQTNTLVPSPITRQAPQATGTPSQ
jgi:hypothetical protein